MRIAGLILAGVGCVFYCLIAIYRDRLRDKLYRKGPRHEKNILEEIAQANRLALYLLAFAIVLMFFVFKDTFIQ